MGRMHAIANFLFWYALHFSKQFWFKKSAYLWKVTWSFESYVFCFGWLVNEQSLLQKKKTLNIWCTHNEFTEMTRDALTKRNRGISTLNQPCKTSHSDRVLAFSLMANSSRQTWDRKCSTKFQGKWTHVSHEHLVKIKARVFIERWEEMKTTSSSTEVNSLLLTGRANTWCVLENSVHRVNARWKKFIAQCKCRLFVHTHVHGCIQLEVVAPQHWLLWPPIH
jgi:hypothetical protein